ncbi:TIGR02444 family protein [Stutzerimonas degradans]|nr:TIGR02444 family protein [Stutzerimonas degradans]
MPTTDLWTFALACYARPGVESACLELQAQGADVCLLLCGAWLETRHIAPDPLRLDQLAAIATPWQQHLQPLRQLRQQWRAAAQQDAALHRLREQLKSLELQGERVLLERLERCSDTWPTSAQQAHWLEALLPVDSDSSRAALVVLRDAARRTQLDLRGA